MKKLSLSFAGVLLLSIFVSCSLSNQSSSILFNLPSDTSGRLMESREMIGVEGGGTAGIGVEGDGSEFEEKYYVSIEVTGDITKKVSDEFTDAKELDNYKFELHNLAAGSKISIEMEVGIKFGIEPDFERMPYYSGAVSAYTLTGGINRVPVTLELQDYEISDFTIQAYFDGEEFEPGATISVGDKQLFFEQTSGYDFGDESWTINGQPSDKYIGPKAIESGLIKIGENIVECTVTNKYFKRIKKTATFKFKIQN